MTQQEELKHRLEQHKMWLIDSDTGARFTAKAGEDLRSADLRSADLRSADLRSANLRSANLRYADLRSADLSSADLRSADLSSADLRYANLRSADLSSADFSSANLRSADLSSADFSSADLRSADLRYADLSSANLRSANFSSADLRSADLRYANFSSANLRSANFSYADLRSANLRYADLRSANLRSIKNDFFARLLLAKNEVIGLYDYHRRGLVDGSSYEGECACFVGTVAKVCKQPHNALESGLKPEASSPTEKWYLSILKGDTPESSKIAKITCDWIEEFAKENQIILPNYKMVSSAEFPLAFQNITDLTQPL